MSKNDKREQKIRKNRKNVSIEDFEALVKHYGRIKEGSKHPQAIIGKRVTPYKRLNPINSVYVDMIIDMIDSLE